MTIKKGCGGCLSRVPFAMTLWFLVAMTGAIMVAVATGAIDGDLTLHGVNFRHATMGPFLYAVIGIFVFDLLILLTAICTTGNTREKCCARNTCTKSLCMKVMNFLFFVCWLVTIALIVILCSTVVYYPVGKAADAKNQQAVVDDIQKALAVHFPGRSSTDDAKQIMEIVNDRVSRYVLNLEADKASEQETAEESRVVVKDGELFFGGALVKAGESEFYRVKIHSDTGRAEVQKVKITKIDWATATNDESPGVEVQILGRETEEGYYVIPEDMDVHVQTTLERLFETKKEADAFLEKHKDPAKTVHDPPGLPKIVKSKDDEADKRISLESLKEQFEVNKKAVTEEIKGAIPVVKKAVTEEMAKLYNEHHLLQLAIGIALLLFAHICMSINLRANTVAATKTTDSDEYYNSGADYQGAGNLQHNGRAGVGGMEAV